jgi:hypothetical protein
MEAITHAIKAEFRYEVWHEEGTRRTDETIALGSGACRDFAVLMMEALRSFGVATRFVTGYTTTRRGQRRAVASQGVFAGGKRPFGYHLAPDGDIVRLVPNAAEMAKLKRMKAMRKKGANLREIRAATGVPFKSVQRILERASR